MLCYAFLNSDKPKHLSSLGLGLQSFYNHSCFTSYCYFLKTEKEKWSVCSFFFWLYLVRDMTLSHFSRRPLNWILSKLYLSKVCDFGKHLIVVYKNMVIIYSHLPTDSGSVFPPFLVFMLSLANHLYFHIKQSIQLEISIKCQTLTLSIWCLHLTSKLICLMRQCFVLNQVKASTVEEM